MIRLGESNRALRTFEGYRTFTQKKTQDESGKTSIRLASSEAMFRSGNTVDVSWLPFAAEQYLISADINDYVICDIPIVHVDIPNRNMDAFPLDEVSRFDPATGRMVYQSFIGKPTHQDHDNKNPERAKGVIFDASMAKIHGTDRYAIRILAGFDRTKDRQLADQILSGKRPQHSMGCLVQFSQCSYPGCQATSTTGKIRCAHMDGGTGKGRIVNGQLVYELCRSCTYIESSSVDDAADFHAVQTFSK